MKEHIIKVFSERKYIVIAWVLTMLYVRDIVMDIFNPWFTQDYTLWAAVDSIFGVFAGLVFLYEIIHKKLVFNKIQNVLWIFWIVTLIGTCMRTEGTVARSWVLEFLLLMKSYLFFTLILVYGKENTDHILYFIAKQTVIVFTIVNAVSLLIYLLAHLGMPDLPGVFAYSSMHTSVNHWGREQFFGLYEWMTDGAARCQLTLLLSLWLLDRNAVKKWLGVLSVVLAVIMILLSGARAIQICLVITVIYALYRILSKKAGRKKSLLIVLAGVLFAVVAAVFIKHHDIATYVTLFQSDRTAFWSEINARSNGRLEIWRSTYTTLSRKPVFGWGWAYVPTEIGDRINSTSSYASVHNVFMSVLLSSGWIGLILFIVFLIAGIVMICKNQKLIHETHSGWMVLLIISVFIQSNFDPGILCEDSHIESAYCWLFFGYLVYLKEAFNVKSSIENE